VTLELSCEPQRPFEDGIRLVRRYAISGVLRDKETGSVSSSHAMYEDGADNVYPKVYSMFTYRRRNEDRLEVSCFVYPY